MASVERDTNCPKPKRNAAAPKKRSPNECARQPFYRCSHNRVVCQHKVPFFNQRSTRLSSCVIMPESKIIHRFFLYHVETVPLHRLEAWKAAWVNSWIHRHGAACGKKFVSELSCRNHACRTTAEQRQLSLLASCGFQDKPIGNYLPQTPKKTKLWLQTRSQNLISKMKPFLASPNETIEAASQNLKLKKWLPSKETQTVQTQKKCRGAKKKISQ